MKTIAMHVNMRRHDAFRLRSVHCYFNRKNGEIEMIFTLHNEHNIQKCIEIQGIQRWREILESLSNEEDFLFYRQPCGIFEFTPVQTQMLREFVGLESG